MISYPLVILCLSQTKRNHLVRDFDDLVSAVINILGPRYLNRGGCPVLVCELVWIKFSRIANDQRGSRYPNNFLAMFKLALK